MLSSIVRWLTRPLSAAMAQSSRLGELSSPCHFLELPVEVLFSIDSHLPYENALALSLTCKQLYHLFFMRHKPTFRHNGREMRLLQLLERDLPSKMACSIHDKLYDWRKQTEHTCPRCSRYRAKLIGFTMICSKDCTPRPNPVFEAERRLIVRAALYGPQFGLPMTLIEHSCDTNGSRPSNTVKPKIVDGSLVLRRTLYLVMRNTFNRWHGERVMNTRETVCAHSEVQLDTRLLIAVAQVQEKSKRLPDAEEHLHRRWRDPLPIKCAMCATDIHLSMEVVDESSVAITLDAYQDLGGLQELSAYQRQVQSGRQTWRQRDFGVDEKVGRYTEDLKSRYHGTHVHLNNTVPPSPVCTVTYDLVSRQEWEQRHDSRLIQC